MEKTICIDVRLINCSGIGNYIRSNLSRMNFLNYKVILLGNVCELKLIPSLKSFTFVHFNPKIYGIIEQFLWPIKIPKCDIFWSMHYVVPILPIRAKKRLTTIYDGLHFFMWKEISLVQRIYISLVHFFASRLSDKIITISNFSKNYLIQKLPVLKNKTHVIYCGVSKQYNEELNYTKSDMNYILYVGNVKPHKNLYNALRAFREVVLVHPNLKFVIVGEKDKFKIVDKSINEQLQFFNKNEIVFTGRVSDFDLKGLYKYTSLFLFPTKFEGFGLPILEAMSFGCKICCSNAASLPEVGLDKVYYFNPYDFEDIKKTILIALDDNQFKADYSEILEYFTWEKSAIKHDKIIEDLFNKNEY